MQVEEECTPERRTDARLLAAVSEGDEDAVAQLFTLHSTLVYSIALRILRDPAAAEDVMQDVFIQIWRKPLAFVAAKGSLSGFLAAAARNRSIDVLRGRRPAESLEDFALCSSMNVAESVERNILIDRVRIAMQELPLAQSEALEMAFFSGRTHSEIAQLTGAPLGTVKTRVRTALGVLGRALGQ